MIEGTKPDNNHESVVTTQPESLQIMLSEITSEPMKGEPVITIAIKRFEQSAFLWTMTKPVAKALEDALRHFRYLKKK